MMKYRESSGKSHVLRKYIVSYLIILSIPLLVGTIFYKETFRIVEKDIHDSNLSMLKQSQLTMDRRMSEIEKLVQQVTLNQRLTYLVSNEEPLGNSYYYEMKKLIDELATFKLTNDYIYNFYIYLKSSEYIITPVDVFKASFFFERIMKYNGYSYEKWDRMVTNPQFQGMVLAAMPVTVESTEKSIVTYVQTVPYGYNRDVEGVIMVLVEQQRFIESLQNIDLSDGGLAYIADKDGNVIAEITKDSDMMGRSSLVDLSQSQGFEEKIINDEKMIVTYTTSPYNGWKYVAIIPSSQVMGKINTIKSLMIEIVMASVFLGMLLALYLSYRNTIPIKKIIKTLGEFGGSTPMKQDDYDFIQGTVVKLIDKNQSLNETLEEQLPMIRQVFFKRLFSGEFVSYQDIEAVSAHLGIELEGDHYLVVMLDISRTNSVIYRDTVKEYELFKIIVKDILKLQIAARTYIYDLEERRSAILLCWEHKDEYEIQKETTTWVENVHSIILQQNKLSLIFTAGCICNQLIDVSSSFEQARQAMDYFLLKSGEEVMYWYKDIPGKKDVYSYPLELEQRLINLGKSGEIDEITNILRNIYRMNFDERVLSSYMKEQLLYSIRGTVVRLVGHLNLADKDEGLNSILDFSKPLSDDIEDIIEEYRKASSIVNEQKSSRATSQMNRILEYIQENYMHHEFGLSMVAEKFGLTEGYLSHFFKDNTGETFSSHIEHIRMIKATELLKNKDRTVEEVSNMLGYSSPVAFRRAFKRVCGTSPRKI